MIKILYIPVNYNSYNHLKNLIRSIETSLGAIPDGKIQIDIKVADNSSNIETTYKPNHPQISFETFQHGNLGYLGGAAKIINSIPDISLYDYIIISNVDLELGISFFQTLLNKSYQPTIGWIAPQIYSLQEQRDKNPKIKLRYSKKKLFFLKTLYRYPILHRLYEKTLYRRKKYRPYIAASKIYAGHGSLMIFTGKAIADIMPIKYPVFLFGEEIFMAEQLMHRKYEVFYDPELIIKDLEHVSTGKIKSKFYYRYNTQALSYIIKTFYE